MEKLFYLLLSVLLSSGRNIVSKKTAIAANGQAPFFLSQTVLFASAAVLLLIFGIKDLMEVSSVTSVYGMIYGILLILSQWLFTLALKSGNTSVCSVIYSLGFILPTLSGTLFWNEDFTFLNFIGILVAVTVILLTAKKGAREGQAKKSFVPFILIAMISSGGLGIMQKVQQSTDAAAEKNAFLLIAFLFAFCCSLVAFMLCRKKAEFDIKNALYPAIAGVCFGGANLCNTILAGKMKSAVFFPFQNISTILLTTLVGIAMFKEKLTIKTIIILMLGIVVIVLSSV